MVEKKATLIEDLGVRKESGAHQKLYRMEPPLEGHEYVVVSAVSMSFTGPETYIFGANAKGVIVDWLELEGSSRGDLDCERALREAGYQEVQK